MQTARLRTGIIHSAIGCAAALMVCGAPSAWAQEKQKISYKVTAENSKYTQRNTIDVGDEPRLGVELRVRRRIRLVECRLWQSRQLLHPAASA